MSVCVALRLKSGLYRPQKQLGVACGESVHSEELSKECISRGVPPLRSFVFWDTALLQDLVDYAPADARGFLELQLARSRTQAEWHDPAAGLRSIGVLIEVLSGRKDERAAIGELTAFEHVLASAAECGDQFRFEVG